MDERIIDIGSKARLVDEQHQQYESARAEQLGAEVALLYAAVEAMKPALRACCGRIVTARIMSKAGRTERDAVGVPGLFLGSRGVDQGPGPKKRNGRWEGADLFLLQDGSFVLLVYDGLDAPDSGISEWGAELVPLDAPDVLGAFPLNVVLDGLTRALEAQVFGGKAKRTKEVAARAERLRSLVNLVGSL